MFVSTVSAVSVNRMSRDSDTDPVWGYDPSVTTGRIRMQVSRGAPLISDPLPS